jgi:deoxycytidylate deaminase
MSGGRSRISWPETALRLAFNIAEYRSEDPYVQVGAVAIKKDGSVILGYNGAPSGINIDWTNRDERRKRVIHAEANVLNFVKPEEVDFLATTHLPCAECMKIIAQKRIKTVYFAKILENYDSSLTSKLAEEFAIKLNLLALDF